MFKLFRFTLFIVLALSLALLVACGGPDNAPDVTPIVISTPVVVDTPAVADTAVPPTATSQPTTQPTEPATAEPTAVPVTQPTATPAPQRIQFNPGAVSATRTGNLPAFGSQGYLLYALAGQTMHIELTSTNGKANFSLQGVDDGQPYKRVETESRQWEGTLPASQDYLIWVRTPDSADSYTLTVTIDPLQAQPQRIQFAPGAVSATVSGTIEPNSYDQYVLSAQVGQTMHVNLTAANGQANFDLVGASDGVPYKRAIFQPTTWEGVLPMTQDYLINVSAPADTADSYTLTVTIDPAVPEPTPERIQFAPGSTTATVSGVFAAGGDSHAFILTAREGQILTIQVTANPAGPVTMFVKDVTDRIVLTGTDGETISLNLPASGDYTIMLYTPGAAPAVTYDMVVTIP